jgi:glycosyltransferase involved in cell wall biosynthesis
VTTGGSGPVREVCFIVIARNERFGIERCLESLVSMTLQHCDIICVDSNSTDGTLEVMREYSRRYNYISVFRCCGQVNASVARNIGLSRARRRFVCFCDGDCEFQETFIRKAVSLLNRNEADAVTGVVRDVVYSDDHRSVLQQGSLRAVYSRMRNG